jgi:hypothetical protein
LKDYFSNGDAKKKEGQGLSTLKTFRLLFYKTACSTLYEIAGEGDPRKAHRLSKECRLNKTKTTTKWNSYSLEREIGKKKKEGRGQSTELSEVSAVFSFSDLFPSSSRRGHLL